jgi:hypothetical protein
MLNSAGVGLEQASLLYTVRTVAASQCSVEESADPSGFPSLRNESLFLILNNFKKKNSPASLVPK